MSRINEGPATILVAGYAGSGKTELSMALSRELGWALLDKDMLSSPFVDALNQHLTGNPDDRSSDAYLNHVRPLEYQVLWDTIEQNAGLGVSVVATAPFLLELANPEWLPRRREYFSTMGRELSVVWVDSGRDAMKARMTSRGAQRDLWKRENWAEYSAGINAERYREQADIVVNNSLDSTLEQVRNSARLLASLITLQTGATAITINAQDATR